MFVLRRVFWLAVLVLLSVQSAHAGIYWLPDYVSQNGGYGYGGRTNDNAPSGDSGKTCSKYGYEDCIAPKSIRPGAKPVQVIQGLSCYKNSDCICPAGTFPYTSSNCSGDREPAGERCGNQYQNCKCKSQFKFSAANCKGEYKPSGNVCDSTYYEKCEPRPCSDGGYLDKADETKICTPVTYAEKTCQSCREKTCLEQGYQSGITCEKGQTTETCTENGQNYTKCEGEACPIGQSCDYGCQTYSTQENCGDVCIECKKKPVGCTDGTVNFNDHWCEQALSCTLPPPAEEMCVLLPTCESIGYAFESFDCFGKEKVACPYDETKFFCFAQDGIVTAQNENQKKCMQGIRQTLSEGEVNIAFVNKLIEVSPTDNVAFFVVEPITVTGNSAPLMSNYYSLPFAYTMVSEDIKATCQKGFPQAENVSITTKNVAFPGEASDMGIAFSTKTAFMNISTNQSMGGPTFYAPSKLGRVILPKEVKNSAVFITYKSIEESRGTGEAAPAMHHEIDDLWYGTNLVITIYENQHLNLNYITPYFLPFDKDNRVALLVRLMSNNSSVTYNGVTMTGGEMRGELTDTTDNAFVNRYSGGKVKRINQTVVDLNFYISVPH